MRALWIYMGGFLTAVGGIPASFEPPSGLERSAFAVSSSPQRTQIDTDAIGIPRSTDGLFYTNATTDEASIRFVIDTGATHVVLSHADARKLGNTILKRRTGKIQTAGGSIDVDWVIIGRIEVAGVALQDLEAAVPRNDIAISLLGQNALAQFSQLQIDGDNLVLLR